MPLKRSGQAETKRKKKQDKENKMYLATITEKQFDVDLEERATMVRQECMAERCSMGKQCWPLTLCHDKPLNAMSVGAEQSRDQSGHLTLARSQLERTLPLITQEGSLQHQWTDPGSVKRMCSSGH